MKNIWSEILVPVVVAGLTMAGTVGVETSRTVRTESRFNLLHTLQPDTLLRDATAKDTTAVKQDSVKRTAVNKDVDLSDEDFDFFGETEIQEDTLPRIFARDTMKVPDSLKVRDPFLYRWYVAVKDSLTHRIVVDSLKAAGDSLDWPVIDSLYLADSTAAAREPICTGSPMAVHSPVAGLRQSLHGIRFSPSSAEARSAAPSASRKRPMGVPDAQVVPNRRRRVFAASIPRVETTRFTDASPLRARFSRPSSRTSITLLRTGTMRTA